MIGVIRGIAKIFAVTGGILLGIIVLVTMVNVSGFVANAAVRSFGFTVSGLPGYEDVVSLLIGIAVLLMLPYCQLTRSHVSVDLLAQLLPERALSGLIRFTDALMGITAAFLAVMMAQGMLEYRADGTLSPVLGWPVWPFVAPGIVATAFWALTAFALAIRPSAAETGRAGES